ncbi:MAG: trehalose-phosphatase [Rhodoblastus sp.]
MSEIPQLNLAFDEFCLFADADGTLLNIAERPESARATSDILNILDRLYFALGGALAIVSGRRIEDIDRLFAPLRLPASGIHGAQLRARADGEICDTGGPDIPADVARSIEAVARRHPGVFVEDKGKALAVHWRAAQERAKALSDELAATILPTPGLSILRGHCVFEVKSSSTTKGDAVRAFMQAAPFAGRIPVFIGDDVTDVAGMAAAKALGGRAFSVGQRLEGADGVLASPAEVGAWLAGLLATQQEARRA